MFLIFFVPYFLASEDSEVHIEKEPLEQYTVVRYSSNGQMHSDPVNVSVVLEDELVTTHNQLPEAFLVLFGFLYAFHIHIPKGLAKTFVFVQKTFAWHGRWETVS